MASPKQKDIAEKLDLSIATVSRSLLGYSNIHPATRKKVIELASEMGYHARGKLRRHGIASSQNKKKHISVGMVVCWSKDVEQNPEQVAYRELIGISAAAEKKNVSIVTHFSLPDQCHQILDPEYPFPAMRAGMLSGLILVYGFPRGVVHNLTRRMPCVSIGHSYLNLGVDCVGDDQNEGVGLLVDHLYQLGHRRIGFLSMSEGQSWLFDRFAGYQWSLGRLNLDSDPSIMINALGNDVDEEAQTDVIVEHIRRGVTAWVCVSDPAAYGLYRRLRARGLEIPRDVSIVGFDGTAPPEDCPQVTTVRHPFEHMAEAAVEQLLLRIENPIRPACNSQFKCEFVKGETTAPPNAEHKQ
ncbi:MAG: LacI family transcriptional regulator [Phycisphaerae bacterium]|nr:LacI family transcriptional regulator [Phycisphaerae bacterium]